jgi:hypothetical protein
LKNPDRMNKIYRMAFYSSASGQSAIFSIRVNRNPIPTIADRVAPNTAA